MSHSTLLDIRGVLKNRRVILFFTGQFSQGIVREFGEAIKKYISSEYNKDFKNKNYSVFSMFVEQVQNIKKYYESKIESPLYEKIGYSGVITIEKLGNKVYISSGNYVEHKDAEGISEKLDLIKSLDKDELKKLYKEQSRKDVKPGYNGVGLGFIDMARKASEPINYWIMDKDKDLKFFLIEVVIEGMNINE